MGLMSGLERFLLNYGKEVAVCTLLAAGTSYYLYNQVELGSSTLNTKKKSRSKSLQVRGLNNIGNSCFLNSLIQCLAASPQFHRWLEEVCEIGLDRGLHQELLHVIRSVNCEIDGSAESIDPSPVLHAMRRHGWVIHSAEEQDCHELFHVLFSTIEEELSKSKTTLSDISSHLMEPEGMFRFDSDSDSECDELDSLDVMDSGSCYTGRLEGMPQTHSTVLGLGRLGETSLPADYVPKLSESQKICDMEGGSVNVRPNPSFEKTEQDARLKCETPDSGLIIVSHKSSDDKCDFEGEKRERSPSDASATTHTHPDSKFDASETFGSDSGCGTNEEITDRDLSEIIDPKYEPVSLQPSAYTCSYGSRSNFSRIDSGVNHTRLGKLEDRNKIPSSPFKGAVVCQRTCLQCGYKTPLRYDAFESISLNLPSGYSAFSPLSTSSTLQDLLRSYFAPESVSGADCEGCRGKPTSDLLGKASVKRQFIAKLPKCLCLHIQRNFWTDFGTMGKRTDFVDFPEILDLNNFTFSSHLLSKSPGSPVRQPHKFYRLVSVAVHSGDAYSGHFFAYRLEPGCPSTRWYLTSDTSVKKVLKSDVFNTSAYMLFYERI